MRQRQIVGLSIFGVFILIFQLCFSIYKEAKSGEPVPVEVVDIQEKNSFQKEKSKPLSDANSEHNRSTTHFAEDINIKGYKKNNYGGIKNIYVKQMHLSSFDPNVLDLKGWVALGFSPNQAQVIINYRDKKLKGKFKTLEEIKNCFVISEQKFLQLRPYIKISSEKKTSQKKPHSSLAPWGKRNKELNSMRYEDFKDIDIEEGIIRRLLSFRKTLGGFVNKNQIREIYYITPEEAEKIINNTSLDIHHAKRYHLGDAPETWLKSHPYFRKFATEIILYRKGEKTKEEIFDLLKINSAEKEKMNGYLLKN
ncbi:MAG: helix-hairpin-helix domain-containing protein [Bergeyella sp.]|nr:helix-hairpin-helix domain-containing protein [Bergeyella sp.]